nr:hypothetical protein Ade03nite_35920 [Actinoplanes derwentensis]
MSGAVSLTAGSGETPGSGAEALSDGEGPGSGAVGVGTGGASQSQSEVSGQGSGSSSVPKPPSVLFSLARTLVGELGGVVGGAVVTGVSGVGATVRRIRGGAGTAPMPVSLAALSGSFSNVGGIGAAATGVTVGGSVIRPAKAVVATR